MKNIYNKISLMVPLLMLTSGCFNLEPQKRLVEDAASKSDDAIYDLVPISYPSGTASVTSGVLNFRGVGKTYENLTGVTPAVAFRANGGEPDVNQEIPNYSQSSSASSINSAMELSLIRVGAAVCGGLIRNEVAMAASARKYFKDFDFTREVTDANLTTLGNSVASAANIFSLNYCGRDANRTYAVGNTETVAEMVRREVLASFDRDATTSLLVAKGLENNTPRIYNASGNSVYLNVGDAALMTCTAFLTSACTLVHN